MTRKQEIYLILKGIERETETVRERYEPGATVDLSRWPAEVLAVWVEQGVIKPKGKVKRDRTAS